MHNITKLSEGAVAQIAKEGKPVNPILQCIGVKDIVKNDSVRYRLLLSDGVNSFGTTMLATQLNSMVTDKILENNCVLKMTKYTSTKVNQGGGRLVVICTAMDVLHTGSEVGGKIGDPIVVGVNSGQAPAAQQRRPQQNMQSPKPTAKKFGGGGSGPPTPGGSSTKIVPIAALTPYQNRWTVKARVTFKGQMKEWKNDRGEGQLFNFTVSDESAQIRITAFKEEALKFINIIEMDKVYLVSNATLKTSNPQYNNTGHDYEMTLRRDSQIEECSQSESASVPEVTYDFVKIKDLAQKIGKFCDIIGVVTECEELRTILIKSSNRETSVRKISVADNSNAQVQVTLWGKEAENFNQEGNPVLALRGAKVSDFGGCSVSVSGQTVMTFQPDIVEAHDLKQWFASGGATGVEQMSSATGGGNFSANWKNLAQIKSENLGFGEKPDYITSKVTVLYCKKENTTYKACTQDGCNKKVVDNGNGMYRCEKCNYDSDSFNYRMMLNLHVADEYGDQWVTVFQEQGESLLGINAQELGELEAAQEPQYDTVLRTTYLNSYFMKFRVKVDRFNDEERVRVTVMNVSPITFPEYNKKLIGDLKELMA